MGVFGVRFTSVYLACWLASGLCVGLQGLPLEDVGLLLPWDSGMRLAGVESTPFRVIDSVLPKL